MDRLIWQEENKNNTEGNGKIRLSSVGRIWFLDLLANRFKTSVLGENVFRSYKGSYNALYAMYQGEVNVATAHLWHGKTNSYNIPYISSMLPGTDLCCLHLFKKKAGFLCAERKS